jgi:hypothetical protein
MYARNTSYEMYEGISVAISVTITEVINGRMFFIAILNVEVPRHLEARLYSRGFFFGADTYPFAGSLPSSPNSRILFSGRGGDKSA